MIIFFEGLTSSQAFNSTSQGLALSQTLTSNKTIESQKRLNLNHKKAKRTQKKKN